MRPCLPFRQPSLPPAGAGPIHPLSLTDALALSHSLSLPDDLATANPSLDKQRAKVEQLFQANSKWILLQKASMRQTNDRFEHLVFLLKVRPLRRCR